MSMSGIGPGGIGPGGIGPGGIGPGGIALVALLLAAAGSARGADPRPAVVVAPIEMFDGSIDQRAFVIEAQRKWAADAEAAFRRTLIASGKVRIEDAPATRAGLAKLAADYAHPSSCRACLVAVARRARAGFVFTAAVHKVSDLIIYLGGELDDAGTGRVLMSDMLEVKADNDDMLRRAGQALAEDTLARLPR